MRYNSVEIFDIHIRGGTVTLSARFNSARFNEFLSGKFSVHFAFIPTYTRVYSCDLYIHLNKYVQTCTSIHALVVRARNIYFAWIILVSVQNYAAIRIIKSRSPLQLNRSLSYMDIHLFYNRRIVSLFISTVYKCIHNRKLTVKSDYYMDMSKKFHIECKAWTFCYCQCVYVCDSENNIKI